MGDFASFVASPYENANAGSRVSADVRKRYGLESAVAILFVEVASCPAKLTVHAELKRTDLGLAILVCLTSKTGLVGACYWSCGCLLLVLWMLVAGLVDACCCQFYPNKAFCPTVSEFTDSRRMNAPRVAS